MKQQQFQTGNYTRSHLFHELKNTAKTRGHRVSILTPQTLILPKPSPKKCLCLTEMDNFLVKNSTPSSSMSGAKLLNATPVHYCNTLAVKHLHPSTFFVQRAEITTATVLQQILT
jgi:hypothetical protein